MSLSVKGSEHCPGGAATFSFSEGEFYSVVRQRLFERRQFGPGGRVATAFEKRPPIDVVRQRGLGRADVLVLNRPVLALDDPGEQALAAYLREGGSLLVLGDMPTFMGRPGDCVSDTAAHTALDDPAARAVLNGPFGAVGPLYATGFNCALVDLHPGAVVLSRNANGPNALALDLGVETPGAGRAVVVSDEESFASGVVEQCASGQLSPGTPNETLAQNVFAWLAAGARR